MKQQMMADRLIETIYEGEHYAVPYSQMGRWFEFMKHLSVFQKDCGNCQIAFSDAFSKYKI
jgi:hypothetical protein